METEQTGKSISKEINTASERDKLIIRQTLFKCASQVMSRKTKPEELVSFVNILEKGFFEK